MEAKKQRVLVVGAGKSGRAAAELAWRRGAEVTVTDRSPAAELGGNLDERFHWELGGHRPETFHQADLIVLSPGVPPLQECEEAAAQGVEVIGELEYAFRHLTVPVICVGGTNGKSTTTTLLLAMLEAAGLRVFAGANLGRPAGEAVDGDWDVVLWEVSSFQLEHAPTFQPRVSLLLNITADHLDRYRDFAHYAETKGRAFLRQLSSDYAVVPEGDELCRAQAARGKGTLRSFGPGGDYLTLSDQIVEVATGEGVSLEESQLVGAHNVANAAAAVAAARAFGLGWGAIAEGLRNFRPLGHRMAVVGVRDGVRYIDDSKGTNVDAAVTAVRGLPEPKIVLIAGGRDKQGSYEPLRLALEERGRAVVLIGEAAERMELALAGTIPVVRAASMDEAVLAARNLAKAGDAVLLSPACASFDMFRGYAHRGEVFAAAVAQLPEGP